MYLACKSLRSCCEHSCPCPINCSGPTQTSVWFNMIYRLLGGSPWLGSSRKRTISDDSLSRVSSPSSEDLWTLFSNSGTAGALWLATPCCLKIALLSAAATASSPSTSKTDSSCRIQITNQWRHHIPPARTHPSWKPPLLKPNWIEGVLCKAWYTPGQQNERFCQEEFSFSRSQTQTEINSEMEKSWCVVIWTHRQCASFGLPG